MENILREILSKDETILSRRDELIAALDEKVPSNLIRDCTSIKRAINLNVGELFLIGKSDKAATKEKVAEILKSSGMQEARINFVIETFTKALDWDKLQPPAPKENDEEKKVSLKKTETESQPSTPESNFVSDAESFNKPEEIKQSPPPVINPSPPPQPEQTPNQNVQSGVSKNTLIAIIGVLLVIVAVMATKGTSDTPDTPAQNNSVEQNQAAPAPQITLPADEPDSYTKGRTELSLNGMDVGITTAELERNLGKPDRIENADEGYVRYYYGDFYAAVKNGIADAFVSSDPKFKTLRGVSAGASYSEVFNKYGTNSSEMTFEGLMLHEYKFSAIDGQNGVLRFAVDRNNRVDYISMRILEEPPTPQLSENVKQAANVFLSYYEALNNKNYSAAFNTFTDGHKRYMGGSVSKFSAGYVDTIKCEITDLKLVSESDDVVVMNYILDARDRAGGGKVIYRQFSGQVEMVRYGSEWKIASAHSTKIKEVMER